jgi:alanyl-tRNA synthetase
MTREQIDEVEARVNQSIREDMAVTKFETTLEQAKTDGATALFGEKYDDSVRVVKIDEYSMELCGGTHLDRTGQIGYFRILREEGIAAGVRRIEAVTGEEADRILREENHMLQVLEAALKTPRNELETRIATLLEERKRLEKQVKNIHRGEAASQLDQILKERDQINGISFVTATISVETTDELRSIGDRLRERLKSGIGVLASVTGEKVQFLCVVTDDLIEKRFRAGDIVREVAKRTGGSGGGKPHLAMAGGKDSSRVDQALNDVKDIILSLIEAVE